MNEDDSQLNESIENVSDEVNDEVKSVRSQGSFKGLISNSNQPLGEDDPMNKSAKSKRRIKEAEDVDAVHVSSPVIGVVTTMQSPTGGTKVFSGSS